IPWYMVIQKLGLMDSIWALVLPGAVPIFNVILLMNFFRSLPKELEEAGVMDGAGPWYMLVRIFLPVSLPALATVTLFTIVGHWNSFFDGLILINSPEKLPLQTYIQTLVVEMSNLNLMNPEDIQRMEEISNRTMNAAKIVVAMIPILLVYPFLQRYFIHGIVMGSVKE
ncbi:MAG TPA: carbohydrate ABC transporter permease, partial [Paenibacillus sp.]|nr:carbohydrate ABC transporter permease [Paenibacillus sp.]